MTTKNEWVKISSGNATGFRMEARYFETAGAVEIREIANGKPLESFYMTTTQVHNLAKLIGGA